MTLQEIHDMAADALAGEELQVRPDDDHPWRAVSGENITPFSIFYDWRIKPTVEVNRVMMTKRQAQAAWEASEATSYEFYDGTDWEYGAVPTWSNSRYRWQEPKWIYVNGEKIAPAMNFVLAVTNGTDSQKLEAAIKNLIEIK